MGKIPKGLSDKDMFAGYAEGPTMEEQFMAAEAAEDRRRKEKIFGRSKNSLATAGLDDALVEELGRTLLQLQVELINKGIKNFHLKVRREGDDVIISPHVKASHKFK